MSFDTSTQIYDDEHTWIDQLEVVADDYRAKQLFEKYYDEIMGFLKESYPEEFI